MAKDEKNKKANSSFFKDSKAELKKVSWPTPKSLVNDTAIVIGIVLIVAVIVFVLDLAFYTLNDNLVIKNQEKLKAKNSTVTEQVVDSNDETNSEETEANQETESTENAETQTTETEATNTEANQEEQQSPAE